MSDIVIPREELPEVREAAGGKIVHTRHLTLNVTTARPDELREMVREYLAIIDHIEGYAPVDTTQVEALATAVENTRPTENANEAALLLYRQGVRKVDG